MPPNALPLLLFQGPCAERYLCVTAWGPDSVTPLTTPRPNTCLQSQVSPWLSWAGSRLFVSRKGLERPGVGFIMRHETRSIIKKRRG